MKEFKKDKTIKRKKIGKYTIYLSQYSRKTTGHWWDTIRRLVEVKQGNKSLYVSGEGYGSGSFYLAEERYKKQIEEYKLKAIDEGDYKFTHLDFTLKPKSSDGYEMQKVNKYTGEAVDIETKDISTFEGLIRGFVHNVIAKKTAGNYKAEANKLIYSVGKNKEILALRLRNKSILGNASKLRYCGSTRRGDEAPAQRVMFEMNIPLVPFNVFEEAKLDIQKCNIVEQGAEEDFILPKLEWSDRNATLEPVKIYFWKSEVKEPKDTDKIKIISKEFKKDLIYKYNEKKNTSRYLDGWKCRYLDKTKLAERHFVGAMLIKVKKKYFLFDVDRNEIGHYRFNPFLVQLPKPCKTIKEAYAMLKPKEVGRAEKKGLKVLRQGEWFFIPTKKKISEKVKPLPKNIVDGLNKRPSVIKFDLEDNNVYDGRKFDKQNIKYSANRMSPKYRKMFKQRVLDYNKEVDKYLKFVKQKENFEAKENFFAYGGELRAGENRPNRVSKLFIENGVHYTKGEVTHTGREHEPIKLETWHKAIPNTAISSFTITGNID